MGELRDRDHLEDQGTEWGLKEVLRGGGELNWTQDRGNRRDVHTVLNFRFLRMFGIS